MNPCREYKDKVKTLWGIPVYRKTRTYNQLKRFFAFGLYREEISFSEEGELSRKTYLLGLPIFGRTLDNFKMSWRLFDKLSIKTIDIREEFNKKIEENFPLETIKSINDKKHVFVFWANSGEIAVLLRFFFSQILISQNLINRNEFLVICTKKYHKEMLDLYFPGVCSKVMKPRVLRYLTGDYELDGIKVSMFFPGKYFAGFEEYISRDGYKINFIDWMKKYLSLDIDAPKEPESLSYDLKNISEKIGISIEDINKTVIFLPDSFSSGSFSDEENLSIINEIEEKGYKCYRNQSDPKKEGFLTYPELYVLAKRSYLLVGIRSGLVDFLEPTGIPMLIYYQSFPDRGFNTPSKTVSEVEMMFTLKEIRSESIFETSDIVKLKRELNERLVI